ncbi:MAG: hypothetical protein ACOWWO_11100 [Peptococcaceae bacterium]
MFCKESISPQSARESLNETEILAVEKCLQKLDELSHNFLRAKEQEIAELAPGLLKAGRRERIKIYNKIFAFRHLSKLITEYEAFIQETLRKKLTFDGHYTVTGLNQTEELLAEINRIVFLKEKADSYLRKSMNSCLGLLKVPKPLRKVLKELKITDLLAGKIAAEEYRLEQLEIMVAANLAGVVHNNFNDLKQQLRRQTIHFLYDNGQKSVGDHLHIA